MNEKRIDVWSALLHPIVTNPTLLKTLGRAIANGSPSDNAHVNDLRAHADLEAALRKAIWLQSLTGT
jgi:hypothetical protein